MADRLSKLVVGLLVIPAMYVAASEPLFVRLPPLASPSLVVLRTEPVSRLGHPATINYRGVAR
jgi:hypothetical protein